MQFGDYARIYDLVYRDKAYGAETDYVLSVVEKHAAAKPGAILELGCGTGNYSTEFSKRGYRLTGIDLSSDMVRIAEERGIPGSRFMVGDIRSYTLEEKFPLIISLFHVFSYLNTHDDVRAFFSQAYRHLEEKGLLVFDLWNGEGVMADPPSDRLKEMENEELLLKRRTTALHKQDTHTVEVTFDFDVRDKATKQEQKFSEFHRMRYFFKEELLALAGEQFDLLAAYAWLSDKEAGEKDWYALYVFQKRQGR